MAGISASSTSASTSKPHVVSLGEPRHISAEYLAEFGKDFNFSFVPAAGRQEAIKLLPSFIEQNGPIDAFIIRMGTLDYEPFDQELLGPLVPHCRIIASASAGYNEFDVDWMTSQGIWFTNTVDGVAEATADMAIFLILAVLRNTTVAEKCARSGKWRAVPGLVPARDPTGLTLGIVGMGAIGKYLARKAKAFNLKIIYYNRNRLPSDVEAQYDATYCTSLHELLSKSDIVSLSCPLNAHTTGLMGRTEFAAMKDGSFIVNTARGAIIDEPSLIEALESGKVTRAGLDVFPEEPNINPYFLSSDKVIIQPHLGGLTDVAFQKAERECFENIKALWRSGKPNSPVVNLNDPSRGQK
ncbi:2-hydroxyacid dehydrogenase, putative [Paecilomyces variotii No. 5]|uniref:2-hydroxyacid dehydrogenase, putative n=1 Tax=Byssochlamys spectabilis (strain No. 5 / NBRC 109023) TaxID=1356009 RepID=V5G5N4_BYSSN|nr:2-hydroxyacid dehydrogenase, putative [Paecilomyces variotii No. 5]